MVKGWHSYNYAAIPDCYPHEEADISCLDNKGFWNSFGSKVLMAYWTSEFDCKAQTEFYYVIKDTPLDIYSLKAKRRYEITRGLKNFYCKPVVENELHDMYEVYVESIQGYGPGQSVLPEREFTDNWRHAFGKENMLLMGVYEISCNRLCGFAHCIYHEKYIPVSTFKTRTSCEKLGVNFALMYGICDYYNDSILNGSYLCDGWRNAFHDTAFQDWLIKYFGFRKAYCNLNIKYRWFAKLVVRAVYPFRKAIARQALKNRIMGKIAGLLRMEEWSKSNFSSGSE